MKKILSILLVTAMLFAMFALCVSADPSPEGEAITSQNDLRNMDPKGTYYLANDIVIHGDWKYAQKFGGSLDGNGHTIYFDHAKVTGGLFTAISGGTTEKPVKISNLKIVEYKEVVFVPYYSGSYTSSIGTLTAQIAEGTVEITNVSVYANVTINDRTYKNTPDYSKNESGIILGGLVGEARFTASLKFERCVFMGSLTNEVDSFAGSSNARSSVGGIIGSTWGNKNIRNVGKLSFIECVNYGNLTSNTRVGGLIGYTYSETRCGIGTFIMERCINYGTIKSEWLSQTESGVGGLFGRRMNFGDSETSTIVSNINYGTIIGSKTTNIGGIGGQLQASGINAGSNDPTAVIDKQFTLRGNVNYGTLMQTNKDNGTYANIASIFGLYRTTHGAQIQNNNARLTENYHQDGLEDIALENDFMDVTKAEAFSGTKIEDDWEEDAFNELKTMYPDVYTFDSTNSKILLSWAVEAGYDETYATTFISDSHTTAEQILLQEEQAQGDISASQTLTLDVTVPAATGTAISDQAGLQAMESNGTYYLTADIEITGQYDSPFGASGEFKGVLNGNGHTITFNNAKKIRGGLLGNIAGAKIYDLTIREGTDVDNSYFPMLYAGSNCLGMVAAYGYGTLVNVTVDCKVNDYSMSYTANSCVGGLIGILTEGDTVLYNCYNLKEVQGCYAGGIVGRIWSGDNNVEISRCANWGDVLSPIGYAGGIVAYHDASATRLLVLENINYGAVEASGEREDVTSGPVIANDVAYCGGIFGYHESVYRGSAYFLCNINYGTVTSNALDAESNGIGCSGAILGYLNAINFKGVIVSGNVNYGTVIGNDEKNQLVADAEKVDEIVAENNFAVAGAVPATVGENDGEPIGANTLTTLNAAYNNAFAMQDGQITLKWAADADLSEDEPTTEAPDTNKSAEEEPAEEAPATETPAPTTTEPTKKKKKGCGSTVGVGGAVALVMILGAGTAAVARRKEH